VNFLSNLERALSQVDQKINDGLAIVKAEQEKLKKQSEALTKQKQEIEGKLKKLSEGQRILSEDQEKQKNIYEEQLQSITIREENFKAEQKNRLVELQKQRKILDEELAQITKKEEKLRGTASLLIEADKLLVSPIIEDVKKAKESYKSVLKTDKRNARAIQGIKDAAQKIEQLTPAYKKVRYWIYLLIILFIFFVINRLIYLDIIPGPGKLFSTRPMFCTITYNIMGSESDLDDISSKIHFRQRE
jgi:DNA repair exonuclease SbcCD ATPase subunit